MTRDKNAEKIAALNDALRKDPYSGRHGHIVMTRSVAALGSAFTSKALQILAALTPESFEPGNDPYGERDFAVFEVEDQKLYAKIDAFEQGSGYLSAAENPENAEKTERVLTLMLGEDY